MVLEITKRNVLASLMPEKEEPRRHGWDTGAEARTGNDTKKTLAEKYTTFFCSFEQYCRFYLPRRVRCGKLKFPNDVRHSRSLDPAPLVRNVGVFLFCEQTIYRCMRWFLILAGHVPDWVTTGRLYISRGACSCLFSFNSQSPNDVGVA